MGTKTLVKIFHREKYGGAIRTRHKLQVSVCKLSIKHEREFQSVQKKLKNLLTVCPPPDIVSSHTVTKQIKTWEQKHYSQPQRSSRQVLPPLRHNQTFIHSTLSVMFLFSDLFCFCYRVWAYSDRRGTNRQQVFQFFLNALKLPFTFYSYHKYSHLQLMECPGLAPVFPPMEDFC